MKAIGIKDIHIKGVYLIKYFAIAIIGGSVGITNSDFVITGTFAQLENIQSKGSTIKEELAKQPT